MTKFLAMCVVVCLVGAPLAHAQEQGGPAISAGKRGVRHLTVPADINAWRQGECLTLKRCAGDAYEVEFGGIRTTYYIEIIDGRLSEENRLHLTSFPSQIRSVTKKPR